jgi:hypothetical protein
VGLAAAIHKTLEALCKERGWALTGDTPQGSPGDITTADFTILGAAAEVQP